MKLLYSMKTDRGIVRSQNQDNCYVSVFGDNACFSVVCDGMGGPNAGEIASEMAVKAVSEFFSANWNDDLSVNKTAEILVNSVKYANDQIHKKSIEIPQFEGMGTTLVAAVCINDEAVIVNVGDSRAYKISDKLEQITKDHSLVREMIDNGQITEKDAESFPYKNIITRALGIDKTVKVDTFFVKTCKDEKILLCSDGLYNFASPEEIIQIVSKTQVDFAASDLIDLANRNGGKDNITAVVILR